MTLVEDKTHTRPYLRAIDHWRRLRSNYERFHYGSDVTVTRRHFAYFIRCKGATLWINPDYDWTAAKETFET